MESSLTELTPAWTGAGVNVAQAASSEEAIIQAGMDWEVIKTPLQALVNEEAVGITRFQSTVRADTNQILGIVAPNYPVIQNRRAFDFLDSLYMDGILRYESAGFIRDGGMVWMLAKVPKQYTIVDGDNVEPYIMFTNTHDGTGAAHVIPTSLRMVCNNMLRLAHKNTKKISIPHKGNVEAKLEFAQSILQVSEDRFGLHIKSAREMVKTAMSHTSFKEYLNQVLPELSNSKCGERAIKNREEARIQVTHNFHAGPEQAHCRETVWAAYNAVSHYADHQSRVRGEGTPKTRFISSLSGKADKMKQAAWDLGILASV